MAYTVQKRPRGEKKWTDVKSSESLDDAIVAATKAEVHAPKHMGIPDIDARVLDGKRVIWS